MGSTTLTIDESTKEQLEERFRHDWFESWDELLRAMMGIVPSIQQYDDGCVECGETPPEGERPEWAGGVSQFFGTHHAGTGISCNYFCSAECAADFAEEVQKYIPDNPDKVIVGGKDAQRTEVSGASFLMDGEGMEVSIDVPGAFAGSGIDSEYHYEGEPVYIYHDGEYRQKGVIEHIFHEGARTTLSLGHDLVTTLLHHPDDTERALFNCPECGMETVFELDEWPDECPSCDAGLPPEHQPER